MKFALGEVVVVVIARGEKARYLGEHAVITEIFSLGIPDMYAVFMPCDGSTQRGKEHCFKKLPGEEEPANITRETELAILFTPRSRQ